MILNMDMAMENLSTTWKTVPIRPVSQTNQQACLVHIYPTGPGMGTRFQLTDSPIILGREESCDICLDDFSVSRRHVSIQPDQGGFLAVDLQSTNGTFLNDEVVKESRLKDGDYLRVGNWIFRYLAGGNVEADYHEEIYRLTIIDGLTGIHNKRFLLEFLDRELARSARYHRPLALILFDLDRFKTVNDNLGHLGGDWTLREMVTCVKGIVRREELFTRYGGEEFAIVLPETTLAEAMPLAERLRALVEQHPFHYGEDQYQVTISLGVVSTQGEDALTPEDLLGRADDNLYLAKNAGRNCVKG